MEINCKHIECIQFVYDQLSDAMKLFMRRYAPFDKIRIKQIGVQSGLAKVYNIDDYGEWVVKINEIKDDINRAFVQNNTWVNSVIKELIKDDKSKIYNINKRKDLAKIAVYNIKRVVTVNKNERYSVTFEKMMKGMTLLEKIHYYDKNVHDFITFITDILNKIKKTLKLLYDNYGFVHHDLHCGNVFIDESNTPIIFDFDWGVFTKSNVIKNGNHYFYIMFLYVFKNNAIFFKILQDKLYKQPSINKILEIKEKFYNKQNEDVETNNLIEGIIQKSRVPKNCDEAKHLSWYDVNGSFSVFAMYYIYTFLVVQNLTTKVSFVNTDIFKSNVPKCDLTVLVTDILNKACVKYNNGIWDQDMEKFVDLSTENMFPDVVQKIDYMDLS